MKTKLNYKRLVISLITPQLAGLFGVLFTSSAIPTWYETLNKPIFSPPNWLFGPVWTTLYLLMGISVYLIWQQLEKDKDRFVERSLCIFWIHLVFNALWSVIFFGLKDVGMAFVFIAIIWAMILWMIIRFWNLDKRSSLLLTPYFLWVSFASVLNFSILILN